MDLSKNFTIDIDYTSRRSPVNWESRLFAHVVLIDQTHPHIPSELYQLKDTNFSLSDTVSTSNALPHQLSRESFVSLGEVVSIDKKKKQILLENNSIVSYDHLVIVSGNKPILSTRDDEFSTGLQALIDALRVKPKIPASFAPSLSLFTPSASSHTTSHSNDVHDHNDPIGRVVYSFIASTLHPQLVTELNSLNKRLYQVQL